MVSDKDRYKRALVTLLRTLAALYGCCVGVTRESADAEVRKAYRAVSAKVHPDKGGNAEDQKKLNATYKEWCDVAFDKASPKSKSEKGTNERTDLRASERTNERTNKQASKQTNKERNKQTHSHTNTQLRRF